VSDDIFETMAVGMIGRFWPLVDGQPQVPVMHGAVRRDEDGYWVVDVEGWDSAGDGSTPERGYPESMVAILGSGPVYFSDQRSRTDFPLYTDRKIHVIRLRFGTATTGAHVNTIEADGIILAEAIFPNQLLWSAYKLLEWRWRNASEPLGEGYSLDFEKTAATKLAIGGGMTLTVKPTWRGDREVEQLRIPSGLSLALSSALPEPTAMYVETLEWLQDLIGLCWDGRVIPIPGVGQVNAAQDETGKFWSQRLLETHNSQLADLTSPFPAVRLEDLGGPRAFLRWIILCRYASRATRGVSEGLYVGASVETRVLNTMSAVAYWVGRHRGSEPWARVHLSNRHTKNELWRLVKHYLPLFEDWVGDGELFSKRLWWDYDQLRHDPSHEVDYGLLHAFTIAARLMLIASLLDKVAGSTAPSEKIVKHYWQVGQALKELLADTERSKVKDNRSRRHKKKKKKKKKKPII
jgi:hypothetical protein